ncbi:MAG TPA: dTDP-4-dehydrorhamnose reductase [Vicinamibacterales bacterium]|nr:dTDP-4-dehydrorhamnose reductase [Vicinamibacterales bacterium]
MRVLVTGAAGLLGSAVVEAFSHGAEVHASRHGDLDITDHAAVERVVDDLRPDAVINCAAYNDVDRAETEAPAALQVNAFGVLALARAARAAQAIVVHYSTDFVFDGETSRPYTEADPPRPLNVYAASKLLGEWFAADSPQHYVLRVESLFGGPGASNGARRGSLGTIVDRIRAGDVVPVFVDRTVSPSYTRDVAAATRAILERRLPAGTYHCVNAGSGTWLDVARYAAEILETPLRTRELTLETVAAKAARPRFCAMSPARLAEFGVVMPPWQDAVRRFLREDLQGVPTPSPTA